MHFHHRHDVDGCIDAHTDWPELDRAMLATLDRLEARMSTQQASIDTAVVVIGDLVAAFGDLKTQLAAAGVDTVDTTQLDAAVATAQAALAPAPAPVDAPVAPVADVPTDAPAAPVAVVTEPAAPAAGGDAVIA